MSKHNSADPNDNRGDTIKVTTSPDSPDPSSGWDKGNGGSDGGKGNNKDTDKNWKWVMVSPPEDPNDRQTDEQGHPVITIRGGMVKVYGNIEVGKSSVSANFKLERGGGDFKDTKSQIQ
ncbi:hypothetical protein CYG68_19915 [Morganella morganii]|uniref:Uncharacterized protein n=1 Tax=Morganella morganii TaxID=582 RepID=A0A8I0U5Z7_MORMO|nr:hypothetical protein [Morganella morganii]MBE8614620.1 hypothetical protein [Morganella morganii]